MKNTEIVTKALEYYDNNNEVYKKFFKNTNLTLFTAATGDMQHSKLTFFDKNDEKFFESRCEVIGYFEDYSKIWMWAWANPSLLKNNSYISRKVLYYALDLDPQTDDVFIKKELLKSESEVTDLIQIDIRVAISSYLTKIPLIYMETSYYIDIDGKKKDIYIFHYLLDYNKIDKKFISKR